MVSRPCVIPSVFPAAYPAAGGINPDELALDLAFAADKSLTARRGPTPTFSRASAATQVGATGLIEWAPANWLTRSEEFNDFIWNKAALSVTANSIVSPNGQTTADLLSEDSTTSSHVLSQSAPSVIAGQPHTFSVFAKAASHTSFQMIFSVTAFGDNIFANFQLTGSGSVGTSSGVTASIQSLSDGWYRCSITISNPSGGTGGSIGIASNNNNSSSVRLPSYQGNNAQVVHIWGAQLERHPSAREYIPTTTAAVFGPRFDHDPVTLASRGLLIEEQRTNFCLRSEEFNSASWARSSQTATTPVVTADQATSPSGALSADRIEFPAVAGAGAFSLIFQVFFQTAGVVHTASVYLRGLVGGERVWLSWTPNGVNYIRRECLLTTSWQRFDFTYTSVAGNNFIQLGVDLRDTSQSTQPAQTIFAWGAQLEAGSFPTSYIPTTTASVIRSADVCSITGANFTSFYNQSEGTLFADVTPQAVAQFATVVGVNTTQFNSGNIIYKTNSGATAAGLRWGAQTTGSALNIQATITTSSDVAVSRSRLAYAYRLNDFAFSHAGIIVGTDESGTPPTPTTMRIGSRDDGLHINGHIASVQYYRKRLTNAQLQSLTA